MRYPFFPPRPRRGLVVYQLVLILLAIVILILALLYIARRNQSAPGIPADTTASVEVLYAPGTYPIG